MSLEGRLNLEEMRNSPQRCVLSQEIRANEFIQTFKSNATPNTWNGFISSLHKQDPTYGLMILVLNVS